MNTFLKISSAALLGLGLLGSCQPEMHSPKYTAGSADFSKYIAVGNSLTAGFQDNGLYLEGQNFSYPNLLSQQFARVGGGPFVQPLFTDAQSNGSGYLRLAGFTATGSPITVSVPGNAGRNAATPAAPPYTKFTDPINNLGVPGIRMSDIETVGYGSTSGNPYFERLSNNPTQTYRQRVAASAPTFFTFWLGNNDVLGYATAGGSANSITPTATFTTRANDILDDLTAGGAKGVVVTIPDVTNIPFFTTVGPSFKSTLSAAGVPGLVIMTGSALGGPTSGNRKQITTASIRDAGGTSGNLFTLTSSAFLPLFGQRTGRPWRFIFAQSGQPAAAFPLFLLANGIDTTQVFGGDPRNPIPSAFVLDTDEQALVQTATTDFNNALKNKANAKGLAIFDSNAFFGSVAANGFITNGVNNTASFITGNLFSLDGVHPTPRGYAVVANEIIKVINDKYGASVPLLNPNAYRGVRIP